jgi:hypothetical protein
MSTYFTRDAMVCIWKFNQKDKMGQAGGGARENFRWLHLPEAGVYKNSWNLLRIRLIFYQVGGELA